MRTCFCVTLMTYLKLPWRMDRSFSWFSLTMQPKDSMVRREERTSSNRLVIWLKRQI